MRTTRCRRHKEDRFPARSSLRHSVTGNFLFNSYSEIIIDSQEVAKNVQRSLVHLPPMLILNTTLIVLGYNIKAKKLTLARSMRLTQISQVAHAPGSVRAPGCGPGSRTGTLHTCTTL